MFPSPAQNFAVLLPLLATSRGIVAVSQSHGPPKWAFEHPGVMLCNPGGLRGSHVMTPEKPMRALWVVTAWSRRHDSTKRHRKRKTSRNVGPPENATFWVNASRVLPPLTIANVKEPSAYLFHFERKKRNKIQKKTAKKKKKKEKKGETEKRKETKTEKKTKRTSDNL